MTLPVFWVESLADVGPGALVTLDGDEGRHAVAVRRLRVGEWLTLGDGRGTAAHAEIVEVGKNMLMARAERVTTSPTPRPRLIVVQAIPKGDRADLAVEVLTEVGTDVVVPWQASRCVAVWRGERAAKSLAKWRTTAREAAKQARRDRIPEVWEPHDTAAVVELLTGVDVALVLHEDATATLAGLDVEAAESIALVVGPEGGISPEELEALGQMAHVVRLGDSVLRTSTAGVVAAGAVLSRTGRWAGPAR